MESIFHEKQEGSLCAQHCLNALLQNQYFSAVDLAQIGRRLDERERDRMAEGGVASNEYQRFIEQPSNNYDDSGFFSVQVISEALSVWSLDMVLYNSQNPIAVQARADPTQMSAFICNYHQHWFAVRKLGNQWFNLNSLLSGPELISDTYLALFLTQLQQEGYSIFIVTGALPACEADQLLKLMPAVQTVKPRLLTAKETGGAGVEEEEEDDALKEALRVSKELIESDDTALQRALQMSMEGYHRDFAGASVSQSSSSKVPSTAQTPAVAPSQFSSSKVPPSEVAPPQQQGPSQEELRQKRLAFLEKQQSQGTTAQSSSTLTSDTGQGQDTAELTEAQMLEKAIAMSMQQS